MWVIIDGYNLIHADEELSACMLRGELERARDGLIGRLISYHAATGDRITLVFDGTVGRRSHTADPPGIEVRFSRSPRKADGEIEALVEGESNPRGLRVVSSDRAIRGAAKKRGAESIDSATFLKEMASKRTPREKKRPPPEPGEKYGKPISPLEVRQWLKLFGSEEDQ